MQTLDIRRQTLELKIKFNIINQELLSDILHLMSKI